MRKLLITFTILIMAICAKANASMIIVDYQGDTIVRPQSVERNLVINCNDGGEYNIAIKPLDTALRSADGKTSIPLNYLYINNNREDVYMRYNEYSNLFYGIMMGGIPQSMTAKIRDYGMVPAGVYGISFEIQATDINAHRIAATGTFHLQFIVPTVQKLSKKDGMSKISIGADDVMKKTRRVNNEVSPTIYINSNADWVLLARVSDFDTTQGDYYIRTIAASNDVNERLQERVMLTPQKEIILAKGKAPANNQFVTIEYSVETKNSGCIRAGNYQNRVRYVLREDRG